MFQFIRQRGKHKDMPQPAGGIFRSQVLPGLWLDADAMLRNGRAGVLAVFRLGLATPEHAAFVGRLKGRALRR